MGNVVKPVNSMIIGPLSHFSFLLRSEFFDQKQYCIKYLDGHKAFYKSIGGRFGRSIACREGKSVFRLKVFQ